MYQGLAETLESLEVLEGLDQLANRDLKGSPVLWAPLGNQGGLDQLGPQDPPDKLELKGFLYVLNLGWTLPIFDPLYLPRFIQGSNGQDGQDGQAGVQVSIPSTHV